MKTVPYLILIQFFAFFIVSDAYSAPGNYSEYIGNITVVDLGTLPGGKNSSARDINDSGYIVGSSDTSFLFKENISTKSDSIKSEAATAINDSHYTLGVIDISSLQSKRAFVIDGGGMRSLGTLPNGGNSFAYGISDNGSIVGYAINKYNVATSFFYRYNTMRDIGTYPPNDGLGLSSFAYSVNNDGLIAGNIYVSGVIWNINGVPKYPPYPPFVDVTEPGQFRPAVVYDINNNSQAVGTLVGDGRAFRWSSGSLDTLKSFGFGDDNAFGINSHGVVVGQGLLVSPVRHHAVIWSKPSSVYDLGTLGGENSSAQDVNDSATVVGYSETATGVTHAFIWRPRLGMRSLGTLGGKNSKAFSINSQGVIVGESETVTGEVHATRWNVSICKFNPSSSTKNCNP